MSQNDATVMFTKLTAMQQALLDEWTLYTRLTGTEDATEMAERDRLANVIHIHGREIAAETVEYNALTKQLAEQIAEASVLLKDLQMTKYWC